VGGQIDQYSITALCPNCSYQLLFRDASDYHQGQKTAIYCEDCEYSQVFDGSTVDDVQRRIVLSVQRNIRTGRIPAEAGPETPRLGR
jgi:predicted nucleic-acid-binding Zn-ribbon protein